MTTYGNRLTTAVRYHLSYEDTKVEMRMDFEGHRIGDILPEFAEKIASVEFRADAIIEVVGMSEYTGGRLGDFIMYANYELPTYNAAGEKA